MCKTVRVTLRCREEDWSIETIHTYIHTYMVATISSAAPRGWDGMGCIPESSLAAPSLLRDGSILGSYPGQWHCGEDDRSMMASHSNAIWACAVHAIHTYTCESSCLSETMSVTLPSTVWYTRGGKTTITHLPSSHLTIYQLAYIHSGIPTMKTCCSIFNPSLVVPFPAIDLFIAGRL
jgi:hypothetical protein